MINDAIDKNHIDPNLNSLFYNGTETKTEQKCTTSGTWPSWISGIMCRNGPGKFDIGEDTFGHWFDPLALLHRFKVEKGQVTYQSKFLESDSYKDTMKEGRIVYSGFGTQVAADPCKHMFQNFVSFFKVINQSSRCNKITCYRVSLDNFTLSMYFSASKGARRKCSIIAVYLESRNVCLSWS